MNIPSEFIEKAKPEVKERIMIAPLSIFNTKIDNGQKKYEYKKSTAKYDRKCFCNTGNNKKCQVEYYYQMDPLLLILQQEHITITKVILITTPETREKVDLVTFGTELSFKNISPLEYYEQVVNRIAGNIDIEAVDIDTENPAVAIHKAANLLQKWSESPMELFVDTHGGFRDMSMILEALVSLLSNGNINAHIFNIRYSGNGAEIVKDEATKIFDFVSGINEFTNYGRIDSLQKFYENDAADQKLFDIICRISDGIQWCNINEFSKGLKKLKQYFQNPAANITDPYLSIFEEHIRNDYGRLIEDDKFDAVEALEWCMRKGFYQQALTIIESKISETLLNENVFSFTERGLAVRDALYNEKFNLNDIWNGCIFSFRGSKKLVSPQLMADIFNGQIIFGAITQVIWGRIRINNRSYDDENLKNTACDSYISIRSNDERWKKVCTCLADRNITLSGTKINNVITFNEDISNDKLCVFLLLHKVVKDMRNNSNHANEKNIYDPKIVNQTLAYYIELVKLLIEEVNDSEL